MIESFAVGARFQLINEASPALAQILKQVRELNAVITKARENLASLGTSFKSVGLSSATTETTALSDAWANVARNAERAKLAMGSASASARSSGAAAAVGGGAGGGRGRLGGWLRGGGGGGGIPGVPHTHGPVMAAALSLGWGIDQAANTEDVAWQLTRHAGLEQNESNHARFRKILKDAQIRDGYSLKAVGEAALQDIRMMQGTPGGGLDSLPEMLHIAAVEARSKGSSLGESATANIGLAHMLKTYGEAAMLALAPAIAAISTADPRSLTAMERGAGYVLPTMQAIGADPISALLFSTGLARAGVLSTKSGTWLREAVTRSMPGTSLMSRMAFRKHEEALKAFGLVDDKHQPTWFNEDGRPDLLKLHEIAGNALQKMPIAQRAGNLRAAFGAQGAGDIGVMADPVVLEQIKQLRRNSQSPEFLESYRNFSQNYQAGSTVQDARTAVALLNVTLGEIASGALPSVNRGLHEFKSILDQIRGVKPEASPDRKWGVGTTAAEGALIGGGVGALFGGVGAWPGAVLGGLTGAAAAAVHDNMMSGSITNKDLKDELRDLLKRGPELGAGKTPIEVKTSPITLNLNIDGRSIAQAVSSGQADLYSLPTGAPASDGIGQPFGGDHNYSTK